MNYPVLVPNLAVGRRCPQIQVPKLQSLTLLFFAEAFHPHGGHHHPLISNEREIPGKVFKIRVQISALQENIYGLEGTPRE